MELTKKQKTDIAESQSKVIELNQALTREERNVLCERLKITTPQKLYYYTSGQSARLDANLSFIEVAEEIIASR